MSLGRIYTVWCDVMAVEATGPNGPGCHQWIAQEETSAEARKVARKAGWRRLTRVADGQVVDACPGCAARLAAAVPGGAS